MKPTSPEEHKQSEEQRHVSAGW